VLRTIVVVPCHNEERRLLPDAFLEAVLARPELQLVFVDDGSSDGTRNVLAMIAAASPSRVRVINLARNAGKSEAVRRGMLLALESEPDIVGYWDADLATPLSALDDFLRVLEARPGLVAVLGSRVRLLGRRIERRALRHYPGRLFATFASLVLDLPVYDTQCGAKLFRVTPALRRSFEDPFLSRWVFDVELLARLLDASDGELGERLYELSLREWTDVAGSQVGPLDFLTACRDLIRIRLRYGPGARRRRNGE